MTTPRNSGYIKVSGHSGAIQIAFWMGTSSELGEVLKNLAGCFGVSSSCSGPPDASHAGSSVRSIRGTV